jgi:hypothetical protein
MIATNLVVGGDVFMGATIDEIRASEPDEPEFPDEYEDFSNSDYMQLLVETNDVRMEEELIRPRVEIWADDFEWQQWVSLHEQRHRSLICHLPSMRASPFCALGLH